MTTHNIHSDVIIFDLPYNILGEKWEFQITPEFMLSFLQQLVAATKAESSVLILWHKPADTQIVLTALDHHSVPYKQANHIYWWKTAEHAPPIPVSCYASSCEMATIAYAPDRTHCNWNMGLNPRDRQNFIATPSVTKYLKHPNGDTVNPCQKPPALAKWLIGNHIKPGSNVLICGAGAGGEVMGAIAAGANVVAVENDIVQFNALGAELCRLADEELKAKEVAETGARNDNPKKTGSTEASDKTTENRTGKADKTKKSAGLNTGQHVASRLFGLW